MFRPQEISATDARKYLSQIINKVQHSSKSFVVKSYRRPVVRIVKEDYIAILEQVLGKKTVGQILQISGNDNLFEATKKQEIRKIFQRRLSGPSQQPNVPPPQKPTTPEHRTRDTETQKNVTNRSAGFSHSPPAKVAARHASPKPKPNHPASNIKPQASENRVLLLSNGKNYQ